MERIKANTATREFKRMFGKATLNELGRICRFCRRERGVTPFRLALSLTVQRYRRTLAVPPRVHPNLRGSTPRYLATNLDAETLTPEHISGGYRLRWQVELLFKEWKSYANLRTFDTSSEHIAEGLIWAALCAATLKRYCAHVTEHLYSVAISTQTAAKCVHNVLGDVLHALVHEPRTVNRTLTRALNFLAANAGRAKMQRDRKTGRLKLGLQLDPHVLDRGSDDPQHAECDKGQADDLQAMVGVQCDSVRLQVIARLAEIDAEADHGDGRANPRDQRAVGCPAGTLLGELGGSVN